VPYQAPIQIKKQLEMIHSLDSTQPLIHDYFAKLNRTHTIQYSTSQKVSQPTWTEQTNEINHSTLMKCLIEKAKSGTHIKPRIHCQILTLVSFFLASNRYAKDLKQICVYLFLTGGLKSYEVLQSNLPIPHARTINRYIETQPCALEGVLQVKELNQFLVENGYPKKIWISEDATKIVEKIVYDKTTNNLCGMNLPIDSNGMPVMNLYSINSALDIKIFMTHEKATMVYVVMAKPICEDSKPFCLCYFGTSNKFKTIDVINRWRFIIEKLKCCGIEVDGFSADGDSRVLRTMRIKCELPCKNSQNLALPPNWKGWFSAKYNPDEAACIQDTVHIGAKFRTRLLKKAIPLRIGE
jgi:hypothetical protein